MRDFHDLHFSYDTNLPADFQGIHDPADCPCGDPECEGDHAGNDLFERWPDANDLIDHLNDR